jgi:hypothetical protein
MSVIMPNGEKVPYVACVKHSGNGDEMLHELSKQHKGQELVNGREVKVAPNPEVA